VPGRRKIADSGTQSPVSTHDKVVDESQKASLSNYFISLLGEAGQLEGILCVSDLILDARHDDGSRPQLSYEDVMNTLKSIYCHHTLTADTP
jgi:hypothetical protein